jgi:GxxExxY protein
MTEEKNHERHEKHERLLLGEECFQIQGAIFNVYREIGSGFLESVYQECLEREFQRLKIPFEPQKEIPLSYRGDLLLQRFRADFVVFSSVILEIKAVRDIAPEHKAQLLNYLKGTGLRVGLLVNFGSHPKATVLRLVL